MWDVLYDDVRAMEVLLEQSIVVLNLVHALRVCRHDSCSFGLVEHGVVRCIDLVASVYVGREEPVGLSAREYVDFVRGCMRAQHEILVDVVAVRERATGVVFWEGEEVKVLLWSDEGRERVEVRVGRKVRLDEGAEGGERVVWTRMESERQLCGDGWGDVGHAVGGELPPQHANKRGSSQRLHGKKERRRPSRGHHHGRRRQAVSSCKAKGPKETETTRRVVRRGRGRRHRQR